MKSIHPRTLNMICGHLLPPLALGKYSRVMVMVELNFPPFILTALWP